MNETVNEVRAAEDAAARCFSDTADGHRAFEEGQGLLGIATNAPPNLGLRPRPELRDSFFGILNADDVREFVHAADLDIIGLATAHVELKKRVATLEQKLCDWSGYVGRCNAATDAQIRHLENILTLHLLRDGLTAVDVPQKVEITPAHIELQTVPKKAK